MRVLIAHSFYRLPGGEDRYVRQQVDLVAGRHETALLSRANADLDAAPSAALHMTFSPSELADVSRTIRRFRPDVVHLHNQYPSLGPAVHLAAARAGVPLVQTVHNLRLRCPNGLQFTEGSPCRRCEHGAYWNAVTHDCFPTTSQAIAYASSLWIHRFGLDLEDRTSLFISPSRFMAERLVDWGVARDRTIVVRNFTDAQPIDERPDQGGLYLGRLSPEKGVEVLVRALAHAGDPPFEIAGDGPAAESMARLVRTLGLKRTTILGPLDRADALAAVARARYVVVPSIWEEIFGLAALEAMMVGRPVIASRTGGLPELVEPGGGILVTPGDAGALGAAIARYAGDSATAAADGVRARAFAEAELTPAAHLEGLEAAYGRAIASRNGPVRRRRSRALPILEASPSTAAAAGLTDPRTPPRATHRLKVLMVHCYYRDLGGENLSFEAEVGLLRSRGHDVQTYTRDNREIDRIAGVGKLRLATRTAWADDVYRELTALVRRERPNLVHFQNTFPLISPAAFHAVSRLGIPVVVTLRNYRFACLNGVFYRDGHICEDCVGHRVPLPGVIHACYHDSVAQSGVIATMQTAHRLLGTWTDAVDRFIIPSAFAAAKLIEAGLPDDRVDVKPNFVEPDPGPNVARGGRAVYAGRLAPEKGVMTMLEAWRRSAPMPLDIIGDGPLRRSVEAFIAEHGLADRVVVHGYRSPSEVMATLRDARVVLFPSEWYETFGRIGAEAFACGVPVIASHLGAMQELVGEKGTGRTFTPGDPADLAEQVAWMVDHPAEADALGRAARATFESEYTADRNHELMLAIYGRAIESVPGATVISA